jgi:hypothetical protein
MKVDKMTDYELACLLTRDEKIRQNGWWDEFTNQGSHYHLIAVGQLIAHNKIRDYLCRCWAVCMFFSFTLLIFGLLIESSLINELFLFGMTIGFFCSAILVFAGSFWKPFFDLSICRGYLSKLESLTEGLDMINSLAELIMKNYTPDTLREEIDRGLLEKAEIVIAVQDRCQNVGCMEDERNAVLFRKKFLDLVTIAHVCGLTNRNPKSFFQQMEQKIKEKEKERQDMEKQVDDIPL